MKKKGNGYRGRRPAQNSIETLFYKQQGRCHYCQCPMTLGSGGRMQATRDHIVPRAHGGKQRRNLVAACRGCNEAKGSMTKHTFESTYRPKHA